MSLSQRPSLPLYIIRSTLQHLQSSHRWVTLYNLLRLLMLAHHLLLPLNRFLMASQTLLYLRATTVDMDRHVTELSELDLDRTLRNLLLLLRTLPSFLTEVDLRTVLHLIKHLLTSLSSSSSINSLLPTLHPPIYPRLPLTLNLKPNRILIEPNRPIQQTRTTTLLRVGRTQEVETARRQCLRR